MDNKRQIILNDLASELPRYRERHYGELNSLSLSEQKVRLREYASKWLEIDADSAAMVSVSDDEVRDIISDNTIMKDMPAPNIVYSATWKPWLSDYRGQIDWSYSNRYLKYLNFDKHWAKSSVDSIDSASDEILSHCGNPFAKEDVFVKGLVVGDIQSGKTASYTSLINKAIDAGFKLVVVFTGTTNELRAQTQKRLDYEVIGLTRAEKDEQFQVVGVGKYETRSRVNCLTNANIKGDIKSPNGSYNISKESSAYLAVIKKRPSTLKSVIKVIRSGELCLKDSECKLPLPVLVIDDEADLASINTNDTEKLKEASGTNKLIRTLLCKTCRNVTYVGYTATPFANVFVKPYQKVQAEDADDIFPDDFIITLPTPAGYSGVKDFFGITRNSRFEDTPVRKDLLAVISESDRSGFKDYRDEDIPSKEQTNLFFPQSLKEAMMCFLIGVGVKISRGIRENCTMLVNVDVRTIYNESLRDNVRSSFNTLCNQFSVLPEIREEFKNYWERKMKPISEHRFQEQERTFKDDWNEIEKGIEEAISWKLSDSVKLITGSKESDTLDYSLTDHALYIVVGGPKLSRGLTLEGLSVSYYGRRARAFDTLLQMGRWFGYRKGWIDVCRVFTTKEIANDFIEAAISLESFKHQIERMNKEKSTPREFGLQVLTYTTLMMPTSRSKMREAVKQKITFSGTLSQVLDYKFKDKEHNANLVQRLVDRFGPAHKKKDRSNYVMEHIDGKDILAFLKSYRCPSATVGLWADYIERLYNTLHELRDWTVVLSSNIIRNEEADVTLKNGENDYCYIKKPLRSIREGGLNEDGFSLRVLTSPKDFIDFFSETDLKQLPKGLDSYDYDNPFVLKRFTKERGLLTIYIFDPKQKDEDGGALIKEGASSIGLGMCFPVSQSAESEYRYINTVMRESLNRTDDVAKCEPEEENNGH